MRRASVLEGPYAFEWERYGLGTDTSVSFVPSEARPHAKSEAHHFCGCGRVQRYCASCDVWVCDAPGHILHRCGAR